MGRKRFKIRMIQRLMYKVQKDYRSTFVCFSSKVENLIVGDNYAKALLDSSQSNNSLEAIRSDLDLLNGVIKTNPNFCDLMVNPTLSIEKKLFFLNDISNLANFNENTFKYLTVLVKNGRSNCIPEVLEAFEASYCLATKTQIVIVKSAITLEEELKYKIAKKIQELTKSKALKIKSYIDETLIGGFTVEYNSNLIDLSLSGAIERLRKELKVYASSKI